MSKIELDLEEAVVINGNGCFGRLGKLATMDKINFDIQDGKLLGWEIDGRKLAVSAKPNEVVEPHFCNMSEVLDTVSDVAIYYDKVAERIAEVKRANSKLKETAGKECEDCRKYPTISELLNRCEFTVEPPVDPVLAIRSVVRSSIGTSSMSGLVHYFVPVNEAAKEVQGMVSNEGLLTEEQLKSLLGK